MSDRFQPERIIGNPPAYFGHTGKVRQLAENEPLPALTVTISYCAGLAFTVALIVGLTATAALLLRCLFQGP